MQGRIARSLPLPVDLFADSPPPASIGAYRVDRQIGAGAWGPVFLAHAPARERPLAVKVFDAALSQDDAVHCGARLQALVRTAPVHPQLVPLVEAGSQGARPYLAMAYESDKTLNVLMPGWSPAPIDRALPLLSGVARVVDAAWQQGLGHGDMHPGDMFVSPTWELVRITGFGVTQALEQIGRVPPPRRGYSAPERGGGTWDSRADVFSLAAIAHELLTGRRPIGPGEQDGGLGFDVPPAQRVQIRAVLARALAKRPSDRFASATAFVEALASTAGLHIEGVPLSIVSQRALTSSPVLADTPMPYDSRPEPAASPAVALPVAEFDLLLAQPQTSVQIEPHDFLRDVPNPGPGRGDVDVRQVRKPARAEHRWGQPLTIIGIMTAAGLLIGAAAAYIHGHRVPRVPAPVAFTDTSPGGGADAPATGPARRRSTTPTAQSPQPDVPPVAGSRSPSVPPYAGAPMPTENGALDAGRPRTGRLVVRSDPPGALVTMDGRVLGTTPVSVSDLPVGPHALRIARPGYVPSTDDVMVTGEAAPQIVAVSLQAGLDRPGSETASRAGSPGGDGLATTLGAIDVDSRPRGARVSIDGRFVGLAPLRIPELTSGAHMLVLEASGRPAVSRRVRVDAGEITRLHLDVQ